MQLRTLLAGSVVATATVIAADPSFRSSSSSPLAAEHPVLGRRQLMTCEQAYGPGSMQCGPGERNFCYNPSQGQVSQENQKSKTRGPLMNMADISLRHRQSCCESDFGFCPQGTYCAPVAGFCCEAAENLAACAAAGGFTLPASVSAGAIIPAAPSTAGAGSIIPDAASTAGAGSIVPDAASTAGAGSIIPDAATPAAATPAAATPAAATPAAATPAAGTPAAGGNATAAGGRPPYVQVSAASFRRSGDFLGCWLATVAGAAVASALLL